MNTNPIIQNFWAKLVPFPGKEFIYCHPESDEVKIEDKGRIKRRLTGGTWIINLSSGYLKIDDNWLEVNQERRLFGGETITFCADKEKQQNGIFDYVFCFTEPQSKNELKRDREDEAEFSNQKPPEKLVKVDSLIQEEEITCSICLGILTRCATLSPCGHNFCGHCLINHLKNSPSCPLCKKKIVSIIKHSAFQNIIEAALKNSPNLQKNEGIISLQKDLEGDVHRNEINGKEIFIGAMINGKREGQGTQVFQDNSTYEGDWKDGIREGFGKYSYRNGDEYEGEWRYDEKEGDGTMKYSNGNIYQGEWIFDKREGKGVLTSKNGDKYDGFWLNDQRNGAGKYIWADGGEEYEGNWTGSLRNGNGTMKYFNGDIFKGEWVNNKRHGKGVLLLKDGRKAEGIWENHVLQPLVTIEYPNGDRYEGEVRNEDCQKHGKGVLFFKNGSRYDGQWSNDKETGKGKYTKECEDRKYEEFWEEGMMYDLVVTLADGTKFKAICEKVKLME